MTGDTRNIYARLNDVHLELGAIPKAEVNAGAGGRYMAFAIDTIYAHIGPLLAKHGIVVVPNVREVAYGTITSRSGAEGVSAVALIDYQFIGIDGSGVTMTFQAEGHDFQDKATNKAAQQAFKYGLIQMFQIATGEVDPDAAQVEPRVSPEQALRGRVVNVQADLLAQVGGDKDAARTLWSSILGDLGLEDVTTLEDVDRIVEAIPHYVRQGDDVVAS